MSESHGTWHSVSAKLPPLGKTCEVSAGERELLLCNVDGRAYAVANRCSHANAPLARGRLSGHVLECPLHGGKLDVRDGSAIQHPIRKPTAVYSVRERNGILEISSQPMEQETNNA